MTWDEALDVGNGVESATPTILGQMKLQKLTLRLLFVTLASLFICRSISALDPNRAIRQFVHARWTQQDGLPAALDCIAQTTDGYIWLAGGDGLFRFDGIRFERYDSRSEESLLSNYISTLMAVPDGGLWVGYQYGGATFIKNNRLTNYTEREGLTSTTVTRFARDGEGNIWAATGRGLMRLEGSQWRKVQRDWDYPWDYARVLYTDRRGTFWVATPGEKLMFLPRGERKFRSTEILVGDDASFSQTSEGALFLSTAGKIRRLSPVGNGWRAEDPGVKAESVSTLVDRDGVLWASNSRGGLLRIRDPARVIDGVAPRSTSSIEYHTQKDGLTDNVVSALFEDLEGDILVVDDRGLDRFHNAKVIQVPISSALDVVTVVTNNKGELFMGSEEPVSRLHNETLIPIDGAPKLILCAYSDPGGAIWLGGKGTLWRFSQNKFTPIALPLGIERIDVVQAITMDSSGRLWVSITHNGTFRLKRDGVWEHFGGLPELPQLTAITEMTDSRGRIWFGYTGARVAVLDGNKVEIFRSTNGISTGNVTALHEIQGKIWIAGEHGLEYFTGNGFEAIKTKEKDLFRSISGIVGSSNGDLWLNQTTGIVHIEAVEIRAALSDPDHPVHSEQFNYLDGYLGSPSAIRPLPSAFEGAAGRLWFASVSKLFWIDPDHIHRNPDPPPISIEALIADGKSYRAVSQLQLPPRIHDLEIDYTALDLSIPERVRFRYRLEGVDKDWLSVGDRRVAYYTMLTPGTYRFRVIACNGDGVWNNVGEELSFRIAPAFYQTVWFKVILGVLAAGFVWLLYSLRLKQATSQIQDRLEERLGERERIARELHDTLLQGFQGLMLRLQSVMKLIPDRDPAHRLMGDVLDHADEVLTEGRERIQVLRGDDVTANELSEVLAHFGRESAKHHLIDFSMKVSGAVRPLDPVVRDEAYWIGREALANAFRHSQATKIKAEVNYGRTVALLRIHDDGIGVVEEILNNGRPGHWGLAGMRERAQRIGGKFQIRSQSGEGTEIRLRFPSKIAYQSSREDWLRRWKKRTETSKKERK